MGTQVGIPWVSSKMWKTFALPRMLYGLEMCSLRQSVVEQLESVQRGILGRIQCLPDRVAIVAVYGLLGIRPIEQEPDIRKLSLFATVMFEALLEHEIAQRQLAVKDINLDSWFTQCNLLLHKYGLSNAYLIKPCSNFVLLIVKRRYFRGGSFCFMSWCLKFFVLLAPYVCFHIFN